MLIPPWRLRQRLALSELRDVAEGVGRRKEEADQAFRDATGTFDQRLASARRRLEGH